MGKNADTIKMGGNRLDCGSNVIKQTELNKTNIDTNVFIKSETEEEFLDGFEELRKNVTFR